MVFRGDTIIWPLEFRKTLSDGTTAPVDLSDMTLLFTAKRNVGDPDEAAVVKKSVGPTGHADAANGKSEIILDPSDTVGLDGNCRFNVRLLTSTEAHTLLQGVLEIVEPVSARTS